MCGVQRVHGQLRGAYGPQVQVHGARLRSRRSKQEITERQSQDAAAAVQASKKRLASAWEAHEVVQPLKRRAAEVTARVQAAQGQLEQCTAESSTSHAEQAAHAALAAHGPAPEEPDYAQGMDRCADRAGLRMCSG